jgi:CheY-like chemotaxis protein
MSSKQRADRGVEVVGPVASAAGALDAIGSAAAVDAAIVDVHLQDEVAFAVADAPRARAIPFVFVTGYARAALPEDYAEVPLFNEPVSVRTMRGAIEGRREPRAPGRNAATHGPFSGIRRRSGGTA